MQKKNTKYRIQNVHRIVDFLQRIRITRYVYAGYKMNEEWFGNRVLDKRYRIQIPIKNRHNVLNVQKKNFEKSLPRSWRSFGFLFLSFKILKRGIQVLRYPWIRPLLSESRTILPSPGLWFNTVELFELDPETNKPSLWFELKWDSSRLTRMDSVLIKDIK